MSKLRQTHFEQEDWNASKDFKSAIIKLEKERVKTWHWWAYYLFFRIGVLSWHISSALKSIGYMKACGLVKRVMCLSLLNRGIWTYIFSVFAVWRTIQNVPKTIITIFVADLEVFFSTQITNHLHNAKAKLGKIADFVEFDTNSESWFFSSKLNEIQLVKKC